MSLDRLWGRDEWIPKSVYPPPIVEPAKHTGFESKKLNGVAERLSQLCEVEIEHSRVIVAEAMGVTNGTNKFMMGRHIVEVPRRVDSNSLRSRFKFRGVGLIYRDTPAYLLWCSFMGAGVEFKIYTKCQKTLIIVRDGEQYQKKLQHSRNLIGHSQQQVFAMMDSVINGDMIIFERMLLSYKDPPPLWTECPSYYRVISCLADVLHNESHGVVLGALCPQIPRKKRLSLPDNGPASYIPAFWYAAAADEDRPMEWRKKVVRLFALDCYSCAIRSPVVVTDEDLEQNFRNYQDSRHVLNMVMKYAIRSINEEFTPVSDTCNLDLKQTQALSCAVSESPLREKAKKKLPMLKLPIKFWTKVIK